MSSDRAEPVSFVRNKGKISFTYRDVGVYGQFINECRLNAWRYILDRNPIDRSSIVDVGCSYGSWADNYRSLGFTKLLGIDPNDEAIRKACQVFDEAHCAYADELFRYYSNINTAAANGVVIHIIEEDQTVKFLQKIGNCLSQNGFFMYAVLNAEFYVSTGRGEYVDDNSCVRPIEKHRTFIHEAGLTIIDEVGTFIEPWAARDLEFLVHEAELHDDPTFYRPFIEIADLVRGLSLSPFSELIFVTQRSG